MTKRGALLLVPRASAEMTRRRRTGRGGRRTDIKEEGEVSSQHAPT
jgi:hypothetical protein